MGDKHFNQLTPAEAERLAMLAEEAAEVIQVIGKILRHGYGSYHPNDPNGPDNRALLDKELTDFEAVRAMMYEADDLPGWPGHQALRKACARKALYAHHQSEAIP